MKRSKPRFLDDLPDTQVQPACPLVKPAVRALARLLARAAAHEQSGNTQHSNSPTNHQIKEVSNEEA